MPMPALVLAFKRYQLATPPADYWIQNRFIYSLFIDNEWVGFSNFEYIFNTPDAAMVLRNTLGYNIVFMVLGLILSVALAIMVNELRNRILAKVYHTILFMPYFISWIIVAYVVYAFVSANGVFNQWLKALGQNTINFYSSPQYWPFIFVFCNIWKYTGNNSIIYLATLTALTRSCTRRRPSTARTSGSRSPTSPSRCSRPRSCFCRSWLSAVSLTATSICSTPSPTALVR